MRNLVSYYTFIDGVDEIQKRLKPSHLIIAGGPVSELDAKYDNIIYYPNFSQRWAVISFTPSFEAMLFQLFCNDFWR